MANRDNAPRLLPKPYEVSQSRRLSDANEQANFSASTNQPMPAFRRPKAPARTDEEWNSNRKDIQKLYSVDDFTLGMVINIMEAEHGFRAS
jgi:hypothetical protein